MGLIGKSNVTSLAEIHDSLIANKYYKAQAGQGGRVE